MVQKSLNHPVVARGRYFKRIVFFLRITKYFFLAWKKLPKNRIKLYTLKLCLSSILFARLQDTKTWFVHPVVNQRNDTKLMHDLTVLSLNVKRNYNLIDSTTAYRHDEDTYSIILQWRFTVIFKFFSHTVNSVLALVLLMVCTII